MSRRDQALRPPDVSAHDLTRFPRKTHRGGTAWFRQHNDRPADADRGAWYFAPHAPGVVGEGRFDLRDPDGTCYLATTKRGAANECIGPEYVDRGWVDADLVVGRVLSELPLPHDVKAANMTSERAGDFRVKFGGAACARTVLVTVTMDDGRSQATNVDGCAILN